MASEGAAKLYVLETQYIDQTQKLFRNSILDAPGDIRKTIKFINSHLRDEQSQEAPTMVSRAAKSVFNAKKQTKVDHYSAMRERLQMYSEECRSNVVEYGIIHHRIQGQSISHTQPTEAGLNSRLQKVKLRFTGHFGKSLVDTLQEHPQHRENQRNGEACWAISCAMGE